MRHLPTEQNDTIKSKNRLKSLLNSLYKLHPKLIDLSLDRVLRFLSDLNDPHLNIPPAIHVAGTNGKGSTVAAMKSIIEAHGKTCHVYTSPHLIDINERIVIAGQKIGDRALADLIEEGLDHNKNQDITFFEMITCLAFLAFSRTSADFCLLETGLGGRLDATNVVPQPAATIITTISMDHKEYLGDTLQAIASEKAGIMKKGSPCIIGAQTQDAFQAGVLDIFQSYASNINAPLHIYGADWITEPSKIGFKFRSGADRYTLKKPSLLGNHQIMNSGAAIEALRCTNLINLDQDHISTGLESINWPARLQDVTQDAQRYLTRFGTHKIWLDGGHNDSAGQVLAQQLAQWKNKNETPIHLILGMMTRKNPADFVLPLLPYLSSITCVAVPGEEVSFHPKTLQNIILSFASLDVDVADTYKEALQHKKLETNSIVLITGSLYLAGAVLQDLKQK